MIIPALSKEEREAKRVNDSHGEYLVLQRLADIAKDSGWIVYRSLRLENHPTKLEGEIDIVVFGEEIGVVLLEVKGSNLRCSEGLWSVFNRGQGRWVPIQDPFEQIKDASFAFRSDVKFLFDNFRVNPLVSWGCVFPECDSLSGTTSYPSWRFCLASQLDGLEAFLRVLVNRERGKLSNLERRNIGGIDSRTAYRILESIAPVRQEGRFVDPGYSELLTALEKETEAVNSLVRSFADNQTVIVEGGAGTGKTKAALFECCRLIRKGWDILFICKSKPLALSIDRYLTNLFDGARSTVISFDEFKCAPPMDLRKALIVDEAQDISNEPEFKDVILRYKSNDALVRVFGDFDCQNLHSDKKVFMKWLKDEVVGYAQFALLTNCRNTIQIGQGIRNISALDSSGFSLSSINGEKLQVFDNVTLDDLPNRIRQLCDAWIARGHPASAITILRYDEHRKLENEDRLLEAAGASYFEYHFNQAEKGALFSSAMEFKGLETPYLVFIVDRIDQDWEKLFYIALSRARIKCQIVFLDTVSSSDLWKVLCKIIEAK